MGRSCSLSNVRRAVLKEQPDLAFKTGLIDDAYVRTRDIAGTVDQNVIGMTLTLYSLPKSLLPITVAEGKPGRCLPEVGRCDGSSEAQRY